MKSRILSAVLLLLFITACNGTFDVGIEHPSNSTATLAPPAADTLAPSNTALPTVTLSAATATLVPSNPPCLLPCRRPPIRRRPIQLQRIILMTAAHPHR